MTARKKCPGLGNPRVHKLSLDSYAITNLYHAFDQRTGVNAGIIITSNSVIFVDAGMTVASGEFLWQTASERVQGAGSVYLILTHHHSDHVFGMQVLKSKGARVIAHQATRRFLEEDGGAYRRFVVERLGWDEERADAVLGDVQLSLPDQLVASDAELCIDGQPILLLATPGHVASAISVYHPSSRTLFAGDTVYEGCPPNTGFGGPAEWAVWIAQLERLKELDIDIVCPGHGDLCSANALDRNIDFLRRAQQRQTER